MTAAQHRILVVSHAHPDFSLGGGELAAYRLFQAYREHSGVQEAWFLARADRGRGATGHLSLRRPGEYLWEQAVHDWHLIKARHRESLTTWFADLIRGLRPTVVHAHHYAHLGLEFLQVIKRIDPSIRTVLTLHEFMAMCRNDGQMIKVGSQKLCHRATPDDCSQCFPDRSPEDFWLREQFVKGHLAAVDHFVAPSAFLRQRYVDWGLPAERVSVIENAQTDVPLLAPRELPEGGTRNLFGFFGQITPFKGLGVLLQALHALTPEQRQGLVLEVHGANLERQSDALKQQIGELAEPLTQAGVLRWVGPYQPDELAARMAAVDWVVVPSVWWENSPMVIQEAFGMGRPVLCSDIGGMKEKVTHGVDGMHVSAGSVAGWAECLRKASRFTSEWEQLRQGIQKPLGALQIADAHLRRVCA